MLCKYCASKDHGSAEHELMNHPTVKLSEVARWIVTKECQDDVAENIISYFK